MTTLRFEGCEAWPVDNEIIEVAVGSGRFDLHNDADLVQLTLNSGGSPTRLRLSFRARPLGADLESGLTLLVVEFQRVTNLELSADLDVPRDAGLFSSFEYRGGQEVGFETDWLAARFQAESVVVTEAPMATEEA